MYKCIYLLFVCIIKKVSILMEVHKVKFKMYILINIMNLKG